MKCLHSYQQKTSNLKVHKSILLILSTALGMALTVGILAVNDSQAITPRSQQTTNIDKPSAILSDTLYVGVDVPYWPYAYYSGTQIIGHDITLMNAIATEISVTVEYITVPWESIFVGLINSDYDAVISALSVTPERESVIDFSLPYESYYSPSWSGNIAIAVREGDNLRSQINEALLNVRENGTLETIVNDTNVDLSSAYSDTWVTLPDWPEVPTNTETTLVYTDTQGSATIIKIPSGAVSEAIILTYTPLSADIISPGFSIVGHVFDLDAYEEGSFLSQGYQFIVPITITIHYTDTDVVGLDENSLQLLYWEASTENWIDAACGDYDRHPENNWLALPVCHISRFVLNGENYTLHLPIILLNE